MKPPQVKNATNQPPFWQTPLAGLLAELKTTPQGLTSAEAEERLRRFGPNSLVRESRFARLFEVLRLFANPLVLILLAASVDLLGHRRAHQRPHYHHHRACSACAWTSTSPSRRDTRWSSCAVRWPPPRP